MTDWSADFVGKSHSNLPSIGEAFLALVRRRFGHRTTKELEDRYRLDPKTVRNVIDRGVVSTTTLSKAVAAERWALWMQLGEELMGQTYEEHLQEAAHEYERAAERARARQDHLRRLEERARGLVHLLDGSAAH